MGVIIMKKFVLVLALSLLSSGALANNNAQVADAEDFTWTYEGSTVYNDMEIIVKSQSIPVDNPIYDGTLDNILDGNSDTHAWFRRGFTTGDYIEVDLGSPTTITSLKIDNGKKVSTGFGDYISGYMQYVATDGSFVTIPDTTLQQGSNLFDFRNGKEFTALKIRLVADFGVDGEGNNVTSSSWSAISGININPLQCEISYEGSRVIQEGSLNNMIDGDIYTYARFNREATGDAPTFQLTLDYSEVKRISEITIINGSYNQEDTNYLVGTVQYSTDNAEWIDAGNVTETEENILNFGDNPIEARYLRITDSGVIRWIALRNISVVFESSDPTISYEGNRVLQNGTLENIIDGNDNTFARFNRVDDPTFQVTVDYKELTQISSVRILNGSYKSDANNFVNGKVYYSSDDVTYNELGKLVGREMIFDLTDSPIEARYIRVVDEGSYRWISLREISINVEFPSDFTGVTYEGFSFVEEDSSNQVSNGAYTISYGTSLTDITDNDLSTYTWFDWKCNEGAYVLLDLREVKTLNNIVLFQGNEYHANDMFADASIYYSADGVEFVKAGEDAYSNQSDIYIDLSSNPVQARYVKVVSNVVNPTGVVIRQFSVNYEKVEANIEFTNDVAYTYSGSGLTPSFTIPYGTTATVRYEKDEAFYSNDAPVAPGWYSMIVTVNETDAYLETTKYVVFHIDDESLTELINLMNSLNTCSDYSRADEVREKYNALSDDVLRETFDNTTCLENEECKMGDKLSYMENLAALDAMRDLGVATEDVSKAIVPSVAVIVVLATSILSLYLVKVYNKYRKNN